MDLPPDNVRVLRMSIHISSYGIHIHLLYQAHSGNPFRCMAGARTAQLIAPTLNANPDSPAPPAPNHNYNITIPLIQII